MCNSSKLICVLFAFALLLVPLASAETEANSIIGGPAVENERRSEDFIGGPPGVLGATPEPVVAADTDADEKLAPEASPPTLKPSPAPVKKPVSVVAPPSPTKAPVPAEEPGEPVSAETAFNARVLDGDGTLLLNDDPERYFVQIDETNQVVTVFEKDAYGRYTAVARQMICSTGKRSTPSPNGTYDMGPRRVRFGYFVNHNCYGQYWSQITRNIYFHSVLYSERNTGSLIKSSFNDLGKAVSHGCVRLMPQDAKWIYQNIPEGTKVDFTHKIKKNAALTKSLKPDKYVD